MTKITNSIWLLIFVIFLILTLISGFKVFKSISPIYLVYLFIFLGGLVLSTLMTFIVKDKSQKKNYLLLLTSLFISLTLIEFVLEKSNNLKIFKNFFYSKIYNVDFDHRDKIDVIKQDPESKPSMHILSDKFIHSGLNKFNLVPLSGVTNSTTILCNEIGYWAKYKSDRYGFRNNDVIWDKNDIEYLVIGDSYAHGACVKNENTISFNLSKLSNKNSINLGIGGNGPIMSYAALREFGIQKTPKKIIWIFI